MSTATCNDLADYRWLTGDEAGRLLADLAADSSPLHTAAARLRRNFSPSRVHLLIEQVELRRRAAAKFAHADRMFFTRTALEQATDEWTAAYKAQRVGEFLRNSHSPLGEARLLDLCCGIGGDLLALARQNSAVGVEHNRISASLAEANAREVLGFTIDVCVEDAAEFALDDFTAWHIDPDRRPSGRRTTSLDYCAPDRAALDGLLAHNPNAAIKLAPATPAPPEWSKRCEREWISRDRECRQQITWHGKLAIHVGKCRATILPAAGGLALRSVCGEPSQPIPIVDLPQQYVFDVDPAVLAARLTGTLAAEHNLRALSAGPTYLTGAAPIDDAALAAFEVLEILPFRTRKLAGFLRARGVGHLELKKRGVDINLESLRRDLKLRGGNAATLLLANVAGRPAAILTKRLGGTP